MQFVQHNQKGFFKTFQFRVSAVLTSCITEVVFNNCPNNHVCSRINDTIKKLDYISQQGITCVDISEREIQLCLCFKFEQNYILPIQHSMHCKTFYTAKINSRLNIFLKIQTVQFGLCILIFLSTLKQQSNNQRVFMNANCAVCPSVVCHLERKTIEHVIYYHGRNSQLKY
ncbi:Hypothetical_protein [Hexamita inflata]|uniref:Hypothetical_protein n=1 Tax=Hexamita inflata TaxID=28002 RepID=A0AA86TN27_9EUKA|nr:Hypothetical protein HINF_LOCUS8342 [Hexamita inflata]